MGHVSAARSRTLRIHLGLVLAEAICITAFVIEVQRALDGNALSWAYVFEWPLFGAYGIYMWRGLLRQEREGPRAAPTPTAEPDADARLEAWNDYLREVHGPDHPA